MGTFKSRPEKMIVLNEIYTDVANRIDAAVNLYNDTTGVLNLAVGESAVFIKDPSFGWSNPRVADTTTIATAREFQVIHRRDSSLDRIPLPNREYDSTQIVNADCTVQGRNRIFTEASSHAVLVGAANGATTGKVPVFDQENYTTRVAYDSRMHDWTNGLTTPMKLSDYFTPDYTTLALATEEDERDHLLQNIAYKANKYSFVWPNVSLKSDEPYVVFAIDSAAVSGGPTLASILTTGYATTSIPVAVQTDGTAVNLNINANNDGERALLEAILVAFDAIETAIPGAVLHPIDIRTAGDTNQQVDHLLFVSAPPALVAYDEVEARQVTLNIGLDGGYGDGVAKTVLVRANEGEGFGRETILQYEKFDAKWKYTGDRNWQANSVIFPNGLKAQGTYDNFFFEHCFNRVASSGMPSYSPERIIFAVESTSERKSTGAYPFTPVVANANLQRSNGDNTGVIEVLQAWMTAFAAGSSEWTNI